MVFLSTVFLKFLFISHPRHTFLKSRDQEVFFLYSSCTLASISQTREGNKTVVLFPHADAHVASPFLHWFCPFGCWQYSGTETVVIHKLLNTQQDQIFEDI